MKTSVFISKRIALNRQRTFSRFIIRLSIAATALSVASMILTLSFVNGFQNAVSQKIFSFWGHIRVQQAQAAQSLISEETPLKGSDSVYQMLKSFPGVKQVQSYATKSAVLENKQEIEGVLFKGVSANYDFHNLQSFLLEGRWIDFSDSSYSKQIVISKPIADELNIHVNDSIHVIFITPDAASTSVRKLQVTGIYKTGIDEYDKLFAIGDLRLLRKINQWKHGEIGGYEIFLKDYTQMDTISYQLHETLPLRWESHTIREIYPNIFDWLNILNVNRNVIFIIMAIVAIINLVTCLLILVLERIRMVGILKSMGATDWMIQKIFLYHAAFIAFMGVLIGLITGMGIYFLQRYTGFIKLDETNYYVSVAPVLISGWEVFLICLSTLIVCFIALLLPTLFVRSVKPVKAIRFR
ncbi:MAG: ABC transporter permease [Bacteroidetes bacterium]|nr:ABC transporter permease [Bacteroidota bacterium]